jgi:hypothetical protein
MSRISEGSLQQMKSKILQDLYQTTEKRLTDRATKIAHDSRECWIAQYQPLLDQLPDELIAKHQSYTVTIKYPWNRKFSDTDLRTAHLPKFSNNDWHNLDYIQEEWGFTSPTPIANPISFNSYGGTTTEYQELHADMRKEAENLCKEKIQLLQEKSRMQNYLEITTSKNRTHKQLREVLPSSLHKYLPPETVKRKAVKKEARHVETPDFLGERQTINLLEDN